MKVTVNEESNERKYPYLGKLKSTGLIVLFSSRCTGTVLKSCGYSIGHYRNNWTEENFDALRGSLTLSNE